MGFLTNLQILATGVFGYDLVGNYGRAAIVFFATLLVLVVAKLILVGKIKSLAENTKTEVDDLLMKIISAVGWGLYVVVSVFVASQFVPVLSTHASRAINVVTLVVVSFYLTKAVQAVVLHGFSKFVRRKRDDGDRGWDASALKNLEGFIKALVWVGAVAILAQNLGYDISVIIAGLGVCGIAIAFALQNILGDVFSAFSIYLDKPFETGDFIVLGDDMGTVEKIGIKSTRIRTLQGEELVVSNKELTSKRVRNFKKMEKRRIVFSVGVTYETPHTQLKKIPKMIKDIIKAQKDAKFDRVHLKSLEKTSLVFEVVFYINEPDYTTYMNTQQVINLELIKKFEEEKIEFA